MRNVLIVIIAVFAAAIAIVSCTGFSSTTQDSKSVSSVTWEQAWNNNCAAANFSDLAGATASTTLGGMYSGSNFENDISILNIEMTADLGVDAGLEGAQEFELLFVYIPGGEIEPE